MSDTPDMPREQSTPDVTRPPAMSPDEFRRLGHRAVDWIADYWSSLESRPVLSRVAPGQVRAAFPADPPEQGAGEAGYDAVFAELSRIILPGLTHWQSPNFFAFFPANASTPGVIGELLSAGLGVQGMLWATSPACTELESLTLDWLAKATGLPETFLSTSAHGGGVIQGTASEATLVALLSARHRVLKALSGASGAASSAPGAALREGNTPPGVDLSADPAPEHAPEHELVVYASTQAHSSIMKAAMIAGLALGPDDTRRVRLIDTDAKYAMDPAALELAMRDDLSRGLVPCCVVASVGTTGTTAIDPVDHIADVLDRVSTSADASAAGAGHSATARSHARPWLHVDAAHAGAACVCPEMRHIFRGLDRADSLCFNPHKWLLTNFDCDAYWTGDRDALIGAMSITPEYLRNSATDSGRVIDYRDWQVPLGRRFRALKLWLVMRHFGLEGLRAHIRSHLAMAEWFEARVREDDRFELAAPRTMNLVCFRLRGHGPESDARNKALMDRLNQSGELYLTHTVLPKSPAGMLAGRLVLRMAIGASTTTHEHVERAWDRIRAAANAL